MGADGVGASDTIGKTLDPDRFDELMAQASADPMTVALECQEAVTALEAFVEKPLNQLLAVGYAIAFHLKNSPEDLRLFTTNNQWAKPIRELPQGAAILRLVFRFLKRAWSRGPAYNTATRHAVALGRAFEDGVPPSEIPGLIAAKGKIEALYREEVRIRRDEKSNRTQAYRGGFKRSKTSTKKLAKGNAQRVTMSAAQAERLIPHAAKLYEDLVKMALQREEKAKEPDRTE